MIILIIVGIKKILGGNEFLVGRFRMKVVFYLFFYIFSVYKIILKLFFKNLFGL